MAPTIHYSRSPLVEAVLAIQFNASRLTLDQLAKCGPKVKSEYPNLKAVHRGTGRIEFGEKASASATSENVGYSWTSANEKQIFQATLDGFSFSLLAPYSSWDEFSKEAHRLWEIYRKIVRGSMEYTRVALRYINQIDIPMLSVEMSEFFSIYPQIPTSLPQQMGPFFFHVTLPLPEAKLNVNIIQTQVPPPLGKPEHTSVILDLDFYRSESIPTGESFWEVFEDMAKHKNRVFEACITDKTREVIK